MQLGFGLIRLPILAKPRVIIDMKSSETSRSGILLEDSPGAMSQDRDAGTETIKQDNPQTAGYVPCQHRVLIALPAYNEEEALPKLLTRIGETFAESKYDYEIIVVDDGSQDQTASISEQFALQLPVRIVRHAVNQGLGGTIRDGLQTAVELSGEQDIIVTLDADNTHPPELIPRMLEMIREGHDIVIASRFQRGARVVGVPLNRVLMSIFARLLFTFVFPIKGVRDYTCGFRAYRAGVLRRAFDKYGEHFVSESGFSCMCDVLLKLRDKELLMGEVPLLLRYDHKGGVSKMRVMRTVWKTLKLIVRRRLGHMT